MNLLFLFLIAIFNIRIVFSCTAIAVSSGASKDGSIFLAHTDDAGGGAADVRLVPVPRKPLHLIDGKLPQRPVYHFDGGYPRLVSSDRGLHYKPVSQYNNKERNQKEFKPLGYIPDISPIELLASDNTLLLNNKSLMKDNLFRYGYFDNDYGLMNEVQLSIVESTCGAKTVGWSSDLDYGFNMFGIAELSKVALERCVTAKCAVKLMGRLAVKYGFYSEDSGDPKNPGYGDSAEALIIGDRFDNIWVFHVLTGANNASAIWAAQRVPNGHISAVANGFTIREMDLLDTDNFLASPDIVSVAQQLGFITKQETKNGKFDFTKTFGFEDPTPILPLYVGRRIWRIFDIFAPSLKLNSTIGVSNLVPTYPFSVKPDEDKKVDVTALIHTLQDHYEGTRFDMTQGVEAGPFHNPNRFPVNPRNSKITSGGWERPISIFRSMFSFITQIKPVSETKKDETVGLLWYGQDKPHGTVYTPFLCDQKEVPEVYLKGMQSEYDSESAWRAFNFLNNWAMLRYDTISADIRSYQHVWQNKSFTLVEELLKQNSRSETEEKLNEFATKLVVFWWSLGEKMVAKYADGYLISGEKENEQIPLGYPDWWLNTTSYVKWPGDTYTPPAVRIEAKKRSWFLRKESEEVVKA